MPYDRKEWQSNVEDLADRRVAAQMPLITLLQRAAPIMQDVMTGSESWNRYLEILQGFGERLTQARDRAQTMICDPNIWDDGALRKLKADLLSCNAQLELLSYVMAIPQALVAGGKDVSEIVAKFEAKHAESAGQTKS